MRRMTKNIQNDQIMIGDTKREQEDKLQTRSNN